MAGHANFSRSEAMVPPSENDPRHANLEQKLHQGIKDIIQNDRMQREDTKREAELKKQAEERKKLEAEEKEKKEAEKLKKKQLKKERQ